MELIKVQNNLIGFLEKENLKYSFKYLRLCSDKYYNTNESLITDEEYDRIYEKLRNRNWCFILQMVGAEVEGEKVVLPYWMGSMNKKKTKEEVEKWLPKHFGEVVISDKLDGKSFILDIKDGNPIIFYRILMFERHLISFEIY